MSKISLSKIIHIYPCSLEFFADDSSTHRQIITIYNALDLTVRFKVLSTAPKKFTVDQPEGIIKPKSSIDLEIKQHNFSGYENKIEKLRIQILQQTQNNQLNQIFKRDLPLHSIISREQFIIESCLNEREDDLVPDLAQYSSFSGNSLNALMGMSNNVTNSPPFVAKNRNIDAKKNLINNNPSTNTTDSVNYVVIFIGLICLGLLFLPLVGTSESKIPNYLHVTFEMKLFASFVLGMVTMVILKAQ